MLGNTKFQELLRPDQPCRRRLSASAQPLRFRFRVQGLGPRVWGLGLGLRVRLGFRVEDLRSLAGFMVSISGFRVSSFEAQGHYHTAVISTDGRCMLVYGGWAATGLKTSR